MSSNSVLTAFFQIGRDSARLGPVVTVSFNPSTARRGKCPLCGRVVSFRQGYEGASAVSDGTVPQEWTDHIGEFQLVFSRRVVSDLRQLGATEFESYPLPITRVASPKLLSAPRPEYCVIEVTGRVDIDRAEYDGGDGLLCESCGVWSPRHGDTVKYGDKITVPLLDSWDASDLVMFRNIRHGGYYCSPRIVELARVRGWTGFRFEAVAPGLPAVDLNDSNWLDKF
jgi:hypothetical protein